MRSCDPFSVAERVIPYIHLYVCRYCKMKSFSGCWTCRIRRKKCDEEKPACSACTTLTIQCHYHHDKPNWMDSGHKQAEMSKKIKREIKVVKAHRRLRRTLPILQHHYPGEFMVLSPPHTSEGLSPASSTLNAVEEHSNSTDLVLQGSVVSNEPEQECLDNNVPKGNTPPMLEKSNIFLYSFYLDRVLPFLFPSYTPTFLEGGKAWILELILTRQPIRQAILCQSLYFASIYDRGSEEILTQTKSDIFKILQEGLSHIVDPDDMQNPRCTVRVMTCIMQLHRLEITILNYQNWQTHLNAAVRLFKQLLNSCSSFSGIINHLGESLTIPSIQDTRFPNAEQAAFRFSSSLVILDDIIASLTLQRQPELYNYHSSLLYGRSRDEIDSSINTESVIGVKNWVLLQLGEIAVLNAWKAEHEKVGDLSIMELTRRASIIQELLIDNLTELEDRVSDKAVQPQNILSPLDVSFYYRRLLITRIWTHAALLYLLVIVSGLQPANEDVQYHVRQIVGLLTCKRFVAELIHTVIWPFCIAGCLAGLDQEFQFRKTAQNLDARLYGRVHKALEIMENAWEHRSTKALDLDTCFKSLDDLVLLV